MKWDNTFLVVALEKWSGHAVTSAEYNAILLLTLDFPLNTIKGQVAIFYKVTNQIEKIYCDAPTVLKARHENLVAICNIQKTLAMARAS